MREFQVGAIVKARIQAETVDGFNYWRTPSRVHPIRLTDGKRNRPLSAHTIEMVPYPERSDDGSTGTD